MNDEEIERRLRNVVDAPEPVAPPALRHYLRALPDAPAAGDLAGGMRRLRSFVALRSVGHGAPLAAGLALALVAGLVGGGLVASLRDSTGPTTQTSPRGSGGPTPWPTPLRAWAEPVPSAIPFVFRASFGDVMWEWLADARNEALPVQVAEIAGHGYAGVTAAPYAPNGIAVATDGIHWNWRPAAEIDPAVELTSIASRPGTAVLAGIVAASSGSFDDRMYTSVDGERWERAPDAPALHGVAMRDVVAGPSGYVAIGWNGGSASEAEPATMWVSSDGRGWERLPSTDVPVRGGGATLLYTPCGFVLSGSPLAGGAAGEPPIWRSLDGRSWQRVHLAAGPGEAAGGGGGAIGQLVSAAALSTGVVGLARVDDGGPTRTQLVETQDGLSWHRVATGASGDVSAFTEIAGAGNILVATAGGPDGRLFVSRDAVAWQEVPEQMGARPSGRVMVPVGRQVLSFGLPSDGTGVSLLSGLGPG